MINDRAFTIETALEGSSDGWGEPISIAWEITGRAPVVSATAQRRKVQDGMALRSRRSFEVKTVPLTCIYKELNYLRHQVIDGV